MTSIVKDYRDSTMQQCLRAHSYSGSYIGRGTYIPQDAFDKLKEEEETQGKAKWAETADWS